MFLCNVFLLLNLPIMFTYFNVTPSATTRSVAIPHPYMTSPERQFISLSTRIRCSINEGEPPELGALIDPAFDTEDTIMSGEVNPFTSPNLSEFDRFEIAKTITSDVMEARELSSNATPSATPPSTEPVSETTPSE